MVEIFLLFWNLLLSGPGCLMKEIGGREDPISQALATARDY